MESLPTPTNAFPSSTSIYIAPTLFTPGPECFSAALPDSSSGIIQDNTLWITQTVGCVNTNIANPFLNQADCCGPFDTSGAAIKGDGQICPVGYDAQNASVYGSRTTAACCPKGFTAVYPNILCANKQSQTISTSDALVTVIVTSAFVLQAIWDARVTSLLGTTATFGFSSSSTSSNTTAAAVTTVTQRPALLASRRFTGGLIGGVVGFVIVSWIVMVFALLCWNRSRKRKRQRQMKRSWLDHSQTNIVQEAAPPGNIPDWRWDFDADPKHIGVAHGDPSEVSSRDHGYRRRGDSIELTTRPEFQRSDYHEPSQWRTEVLRKPVPTKHQRNVSSLSGGRSKNTSSLSETRSRQELPQEEGWRMDKRHKRNNSSLSSRKQRREATPEDAWWTEMAAGPRSNSERSGRSQRERSPAEILRREMARHKRNASSASSGQSPMRHDPVAEIVRKPEAVKHQRNISNMSDPWRKPELTPVLEDSDRYSRFR